MKLFVIILLIVEDNTKIIYGYRKGNGGRDKQWKEEAKIMYYSKMRFRKNIKK